MPSPIPSPRSDHQKIEELPCAIVNFKIDDDAIRIEYAGYRTINTTVGMHRRVGKMLRTPLFQTIFSMARQEVSAAVDFRGESMTFAAYLDGENDRFMHELYLSNGREMIMCSAGQAAMGWERLHANILATGEVLQADTAYVIPRILLRVRDADELSTRVRDLADGAGAEEEEALMHVLRRHVLFQDRRACRLVQLFMSVGSLMPVAISKAYPIASAPDVYPTLSSEALGRLLRSRRGCCCVCGLGGSRYRCGGCHGMRYCAAGCQRAHWPEHKEECEELEKAYGRIQANLLS
ncbi:Ankyrin repeat and MYND domain-containing protein 2 [Tetrabaena socialis]|uniref:Ankyrin repeat and MYND domain-containing protein 2 n=1 Tax=Tetrabaena socialis TaxID=47790 RepID=A0A2J7ZKS0_9CHLO|nr:Ankyrin repeat and MYND domain-containing protein 2 [Tetrabaena socialis]|eukprot:PNH00868.1 Ankyrin repeat and MYND domain-containing protein 2 [Tetrabaena socialis]